MRNGPTLVAILVTHDAVDDVEKATAGDGGLLARFSKHRDRFELAATAKHQRGQFEEEIARSTARMRESIAPYTRFVRTEGEKLRETDERLGQLKTDLERVRQKVVGLAA